MNLELNFKNIFLTNVEILNEKNGESEVLLEFISGRNIILAFEQQKNFANFFIFLRKFWIELFPNFLGEFLFHEKNILKKVDDFRLQVNEKLKTTYSRKKNQTKGNLDLILLANRLTGKISENFENCAHFPKFDKNIFEKKNEKFEEKEIIIKYIKERFNSWLHLDELIIFWKNLKDKRSFETQTDVPLTTIDFYDNSQILSNKNLKESEKTINNFGIIMANFQKNETVLEDSYFANSFEMNDINSKQDFLRNENMKFCKSEIEQKIENKIINKFPENQINLTKKIYQRKKMLESEVLDNEIKNWLRIFFEIHGKKSLVLKGLEIKSNNESFFISNQINLFLFNNLIKKVFEKSSKSFKKNQEKQELNLKYNFEGKIIKLFHINFPFFEVLVEGNKIEYFRANLEDLTLKKLRYIELRFSKDVFKKIIYFKLSVF